jgi:hypothetical protein
MTQTDFTITPTVDAAQEFIEIATDFSNPLDLVREAISNSFDAKAKTIRIAFTTIRDAGERVLFTEIEDDGTGMDEEGLKSFFDLGNSLRRDDPKTIGDKGHGTKVYFNSGQITVKTTQNGRSFVATMMQPFRSLHERVIPEVTVSVDDTPGKADRTLIQIKGYNNNRRERFQQDILKDYVMWFTKFGSVETEFGLTHHKDVRLLLKGLDIDVPEEILFGHFFPAESKDVTKLFDQHLVDAPEHYCRKIKRDGKLKNFPEIKYQAIFCIEGNKVKLSYNPMLRRKGYVRGIYKVQDRYGLWLCKDFIPIQTANDWFGSRGTEYIKFHAFLNCQDLRLTANRGSINNTPSEVLDDLKREVQEIYEQISASDDWRQMEWLESEASAHHSTEREKKDFEDRKKRFNASTVADFKGHVLAEPKHESAVFGLVIKLSTIEPAIFPFEILDYNTHQGYDLLVKGDHATPIHQSKLFYVELKWILAAQLNHSFENLKAIVTWSTGVKHGGTVTDINGEERTLHVDAPESSADVTSYFLDHPKKGLKIQVFVLREYLREKYKVEFRSRTAQEGV